VSARRTKRIYYRSSMHLRRALLLLAIVLGLAAIVASVSRRGPAGKKSVAEPRVELRPQAPLSTARSARRVHFSTREPSTIRRLGVGRPGEVSVSTASAGLISVPGLGLTRAAEPRTPARFELFETTPGKYAVVFSPAGRRGDERIGTLVLRR
jgi:hypothetical protein